MTTTSSEMIERVAEAIAKMCTGHLIEHPHGTGRVTAGDIARAAIEAMRLPTEAMDDAGVSALDWNTGYTEVWQAMIAAALGESPDPNITETWCHPGVTVQPDLVQVHQTFTHPYAVPAPWMWPFPLVTSTG